MNTKKTKTIALLFIVGVLALNACESKANDVVEAEKNLVETEENLADAKMEFDEELIVYKSEMKQELDKNKKLISLYKESLKNSSKTQREAHEVKILRLEEQNLELEKRIENFRTDEPTQWEEFKVQFNKDMESIGSSIQGITSTT